MKRYRLIAILIFVMCAGFGSTGAMFAQEDHSADTSKVERKNRAPVSKDLLKVTLPKATEATVPPV